MLANHAVQEAVANKFAANTAEKVVLVHLGERARPVKFSGGLKNLQPAIASTFCEVLKVENQ